MEQDCVVTALLQQNDALQKQLQELLAASTQQPAPVAASPPAAAAAEAECSTAVKQLTGNERRLVKLLKKMQKDKERWARTASEAHSNLLSGVHALQPLCSCVCCYC
jgi:cell division septum initiation protein DivIVA